ncbi:tripartite tricarboxylate transporter TctB family protein [Parasalinivibrio latis]|uniref:tripartite tricarboxylate transporter TctB family protein n=1 Tax=Parasalinivibrio latis TaxID=2952610 RepID=UPI0030DE489C
MLKYKSDHSHTSGKELDKTPINRLDSDGIFSLVIVAVCIILFTRSFYLPDVQWDPMGMAAWPRVIIIILAMLAIQNLFTKYRNKSELFKVEWPLSDFFVIAFLCLYSFLLETVGFYLLTPPALMVLALWWSGFEKRFFIKSFVTSVLATLWVYVVFELGVSLQLPLGLLEGLQDV